MFRDFISKSDNELIIYGADNFSQFPRRDNTISSKTDRALAAACADDAVILRGQLDHDYHKWLRSLGLGSDLVVSYDAQCGALTLSELIITNPDPVLELIKKTNRKPVYVPWYSGNAEKEAARVIGAELLGASETETLKYNDKALFKNLCAQLDIAVVGGNLFTMNAQCDNNFKAMLAIVNGLLLNHKKVIIRGTLGELGTSLYKTTGIDIEEIYESIVASGEKTVLIEPFLNVSSSPNDQWIISRDKTVHHIGVNDQICTDGILHAGNSNAMYLAQNTLDYINQVSLKLVTEMAQSGYVGVVGLDYIVTDTGVYPIENNARFNGSSYVNLIVDNIQQATGKTSMWKSMKVKVAPCSFAHLTQRLKDSLYDGVKMNSIFPYNCEKLDKTGDFSIIYLAEDASAFSMLEQSVKYLCRAQLVMAE